jgi:hypothetical protein
MIPDIVMGTGTSLVVFVSRRRAAGRAHSTQNRPKIDEAGISNPKGASPLWMDM